jgi:hypothetical protein
MRTLIEQIDHEFKNGMSFEDVALKHGYSKVELAQIVLSLCEREELRDHAFGDREIIWSFDGAEVAGGYLGSMGSSVWIYRYTPVLSPDDDYETIASFSITDEARELVKCGKLKRIERNDMQGDDIPNYRGA